jgi:hypothetical protein
MQTLVLVIADRFMRGLRPYRQHRHRSCQRSRDARHLRGRDYRHERPAPATAAVGPLGVGSIAFFVVWLVGMLALGHAATERT